MKASERDPSGFTCMDCGLRYPWIMSQDEEDCVSRCRACVRFLPSTRRYRAYHKHDKAHPVFACCIRCRTKVSTRPDGSICGSHDPWTCRLLRLDIARANTSASRSGALKS